MVTPTEHTAWLLVSTGSASPSLTHDTRDIPDNV